MDGRFFHPFAYMEDIYIYIYIYETEECEKDIS